MTPADILAKLFIPVDKQRLEKAQAVAIRQKVQWADVLAAMTDEQRQQVNDAQSA